MIDPGGMVERAKRPRPGWRTSGGPSWREGLGRLADAINTEADLNQMGEEILGDRGSSMLLANRLRIVGDAGRPSRHR